MKYTLGAYTMDVDKPFKSINEAVEYVQERHPELSREDVENHLKPKIMENGTDNSKGTGPEIEESGKGTAKAGKRRAEAGENGEDKPG